MTNAALKAWVPRLAQMSVCVAGDVILDEYLTGRAARMSREAPVPVLEFEQQQHILGGAANPAANLAALGASAAMVGIIGADAAGQALSQLLDARQIVNALVIDPTRMTTVKTRILAHMGLRFPQQVARLDRVSRTPLTSEAEQRLCEALRSAAGSAHALLISDYQVGMLTPVVIAEARALADSVLLSADAQGQFDKYSGFGIVKCNADEASAHLRRALRTDEDFADAAQELCTVLKLTVGMVITRGADGATVADCHGSLAHLRAPAITDVYDTVGAGDTAIAVITVAVAAGAPLREAAELSNYASGLVVRRVGNYTPTPEELMRALDTWGM